MKYLVVYASSHEVSKEYIQSQKSTNSNVDFLETGMGITNVLLSLHDYLKSNPKPDGILNVGTCAAFSKSFPIGHVLKVGVVRSNNPLQDEDIDICTSSHNRLITCDQFITDHDQLNKDAEFIDMECYALAAFCLREQIPYASWKVVSDHVGATSVSFWENSVRDLRKQLESVIEGFILSQVRNY